MSRQTNAQRVAQGSAHSDECEALLRDAVAFHQPYIITVTGAHYQTLVRTPEHNIVLCGRVVGGGSVTIDLQDPVLLSFLEGVCKRGVEEEGVWDYVEYMFKFK
jgi:hypothetical protein